MSMNDETELQHFIEWAKPLGYHVTRHEPRLQELHGGWPPTRHFVQMGTCDMFESWKAAKANAKQDQPGASLS